MHQSNVHDMISWQTHVRKLDKLVFRDSLGDLVDLVGDLLWSGSTVGDVELDTEIIVGSTGVVARRQQYTSVGLFAPNQG